MSASNTTDRVIAERYALHAPLGRGGMGTVWRGEDVLLRRRVAIKAVEFPTLVPEAERSHMQARALREARAAARMAHPGAVTVYDVRQEDGKAYIVMELFEAPTLEELVEREGPLDPRRAAEIGLQVAGALETAHREGIVHRDVKPGNVMVAPDGRVKLADFGIASLKDDPKITATGLVLGSPSYMAPEQAQGRVSGPAVDLWALGATLYFAVEGVPAFDKGQAIPTLTAVIEEDPQPMRRAGPLEPVISALLAKDPRDRPSDQELRTALMNVIAEESTPSSVTPATPEDETLQNRGQTWAPVSPLPITEISEPDEPDDERAPRRALPIAAVAVLALGLIALLIAWGMTRGDDPATTAANGGRKADAQSRQSPKAGSNDETGSEPAAEQPGAAVPATGTVPANWVAYDISTTGYEISYPPGWTVVPSSTDATSVDFRDPVTGTYLRVDWTDSPGPSALEAWRSQERYFSSNPENQNYQRLRLEPTIFKGMANAAIWEFTYSNGGAALHAIDIGFVTNDREHGFALYFQTHSEDWVSSQDLLESFQAAFVPAS